MFKEKTRLLASHLPESLYEHLGLYCSANNVPRSQIVLDLIKELLATAPKVEVLYKTIGEELYGHWKIAARNPAKIYTWDQFMADLEEDLKKKKFNEYSITQIIKEVQNEKDKTNK